MTKTKKTRTKKEKQISALDKLILRIAAAGLAYIQEIKASR